LPTNRSHVIAFCFWDLNTISNVQSIEFEAGAAVTIFAAIGNSFYSQPLGHLPCASVSLAKKVDLSYQVCHNSAQASVLIIHSDQSLFYAGRRAWAVSRISTQLSRVIAGPSLFLILASD
jgi:hypothetical protein